MTEARDPSSDGSPNKPDAPMGPTLARGPRRTPPHKACGVTDLPNLSTPHRRSPSPPRAPSQRPTLAALPHARYRARSCKPAPRPAPPDREYVQVLPKGPNARVGLALSDIPDAGWGVFALRDLKPGLHVLEYGGVRRNRDWVENPLNDARYVWSDENMESDLSATGRSVLYLDANPAVTDSWGGRVNDGFHRGANLTTVRLPNRDTVMLKVTVPILAGEELYLSYGADYWQGHFHTLPPMVQADAAAHYDLTVLRGVCYTPAQRSAAAEAGLLHKRGGVWHTGPPVRHPRPITRLPPLPPRLPFHQETSPSTSRPTGTRGHRPPSAPPPPAYLYLGHYPVSTSTPSSQGRPSPDLPNPPTENSPPPQPGPVASPAYPDESVTPAAWDPPDPPTENAPPPQPGPVASSAYPDEGVTPTARAPELGPTAFPLSEPSWGDLLSTPMANCIRIGWAPTAATLRLLEELLSSPSPDLGQLFTTVTARGSAAAFRYWRLPTGPTAPWFHPGPLDGIIADYIMKARAASGQRSPKQHGTLDPADPADAEALVNHCQRLKLVRESGPRWSPDGDAPPWARACHLTATSLRLHMEPNLAYTCFLNRGATHPDDPTAQFALCYADSRIHSTWDFTWADLQLLSESPNYCAASDKGFAPVVLSAPDWETERIRWGIHSLCQHTVEAVLLQTQGPPPPVWQRRRRPDGQPAFIPTNPPGRSHLGPPRRPPPADTRDSGAPHRGLPDGCRWCPDQWWSTSPSERLRQVRGPFSLSFQGVQLNPGADITVCSLNTNGLTAAKLTELLWLRAQEDIDILILVDTRCSGRQLKFLSRQARDSMGIGSWTHGSPSRGLTIKGRPSRHEMVGGQLILIPCRPDWAGGPHRSHDRRQRRGPAHTGYLLPMPECRLHGPLQQTMG